MTTIERYFLGPRQPALLAALAGLPQLLPAGQPPATNEPGSPDEPFELITDFEDHRNHGIGD